MGLYQSKFWFHNLFNPYIKYLKNIHPNFFCALGVLTSIIIGVTFYFSGNYPMLLLLSIVLILLRMFFNAVDGMVAIARGIHTPEGEIINALPDRYSDIFMFLGLCLSPYSNNIFAGFIIATLFLVSYSGMIGRVVGVKWQTSGPMGKVDRLIYTIIAVIIQYFFVLYNIQIPSVFGLHFTIIEIFFLWFIVGGQVTVYNRVKDILKELKQEK